MASLYRFANHHLDIRRRVLVQGGVAIDLPPKEFDLLAALVTRAGELVTRHELQHLAWRDGTVSDDTINQHISTLRRRLGERRGGPTYIVTMRRAGYCFVEPVQMCLPGADDETTGDPPLSDSAEDLETARLYSRGRALCEFPTEANLQRAIGLFENALRRSRLYALAYVGLAEAYALLAQLGYAPPKTAFERSRSAAERALELSDAAGHAYLALGDYLAFYKHDMSSADAVFRKALQQIPADFASHLWYASFLMINHRFDKALTTIVRAIEAEPAHPAPQFTLAQYYRVNGDYKRAVSQLRAVTREYPTYGIARLNYGATLVAAGDSPRGVAELERAAKRHPSVVTYPILGWAYGIAGMRERAVAVQDSLEQLAESRYVSRFSRAFIAIGLDDKSRALSELERSADLGEGSTVFMHVLPPFEPLWHDSRYLRLADRMRLPV